MLASSSFRKAESMLCNRVERHFYKCFNLYLMLLIFLKTARKSCLRYAESRSGTRMSLAIWTELTYGNE